MGKVLVFPTTIDDCFERLAQPTKWKVGEGTASVDGNGTPVATVRLSIADLRVIVDALDEYDGIEDQHVDEVFDKMLAMSDWLEDRINARALVAHPSHRLETDDGNGD